MSGPTDVVVVGAGHNGLVAANYLRQAGLGVEVFERRGFVGGACVTEELWPGFRFSACAHMVHGLSPRVIDELGLRSRGLDIIPRSFAIRLLGDGTYDGPPSWESSKNLGAAKWRSQEELRGERELQAWQRQLIDIFTPYRLREPPTLAQLSEKVHGTPADPVLEDALTHRWSDICRRFLPSDFLRERHFGRLASYDRDPIALAIAYGAVNAEDKETNEKPESGYIRGGMGTLTRILAQRAKDLGVGLHVGCGVQRFIVEKGRVLGVRLDDGTEVRSRAVVSNLDPKRTFLRLCRPDDLDPTFRARVEGIFLGPSSVKLLAVLSEVPRWEAWDGDPALPGMGTVAINRAWLTCNAPMMPSTPVGFRKGR